MTDDPQVRTTQLWLNNTYASHAQWVTVQVDGQTGWGTMNALVRALQIELGISTLSDNFGPTTLSRFASQIGSISASTTNTNVLRIAQGGLWCKGYHGGFTRGVFDSDVAAGISFLTGDIGFYPVQSISPKVMKALLNMDAFKLLSGGSSSRRQAQQWMNNKYVGRADFSILPCDGLYSRNTQQGLMYAIQYEAGMVDGVANGNFGPGTRSALQTQAIVSQGTVDSTKNWVRLFQAALRFNGYDAPFIGQFDSATRNATLSFQGFAELSGTGSGDFQTWASLLISTGDENRPASASDMATQLNSSLCSALYSNGYRTVGRYLTVTSKRYAPGELDAIFNAGLKTFPIMQEANTSAADFTETKGRDHGFQALRRLRQLGFKEGATVFFAVDFDATDAAITASVIPYFQGVKASLNSSRTPFAVGIYGTRNVCARVINAGLASEAFIASMSWGWSGNLGYSLPPAWSYDQIKNTILTGTSMEIDRNVQSSRAVPVGQSGVVKTPLKSASGGGTTFDEDYFWFLTEQCILAEQSARLSPFAEGNVNEYVLHRMQREQYWFPAIHPTGDSDALWNVYTPLPEMVPGLPATASNGIALARGDYESKASSPPETSRTRISHWAASTRSYLTWGVPQSDPSISTGDLGGWGLDLATLWEDFSKNVRPTFSGSVAQWFRDNVGAPGMSFDGEDLAADVDAYLCARRMSGGYRPISDIVREIEVGIVPRFATFAAERFGTKANAISAATQLFGAGWPWIDFPVNAKISVPKPEGQLAIDVATGFANAIWDRT